MKTTAAKKSDGDKKISRRAFTLVELLTVIAVIGVLAALLFPAFSAVKKHATINRAQTEMAQLETAIERYKAAYGFYPPDNTNSPVFNQLFYELTGTVLTNQNFQTLDGGSIIPTNAVSTFFNVSGFINCTKPNAGDDAAVAKNFLSGLKPNQIGSFTNGAPGESANLIVSSIDWPNSTNAPIANAQSQNNPWRYNSHDATNNPGAYDLWLQIVIKPGETNLICNWSRQVQVNSPLR